MSDYPVIPFPDELTRLEQVNARPSDVPQQAEAPVRRADRECADAKKYMADHRRGIDPHEIFQNELLLKQTDRTGTPAVEMQDRIAKLKDSPYFARIDFRGEQEEEGQPYYIGRFVFQYGNKPLVFNWCAPTSGVLYDCEAGAVGFMVPAGWTTGELTRKRQSKIRSGVMEYALENSANVQDDALQRELSRTSDEKVKFIISTIRREQNQIIRGEKEGTMIVQGVTGSGKVSVALHRIAFLLYRLKDGLTARSAAILSLNKVFRDYISGVIPELDEKPTYEMGSGELAGVQLEGVIDFGPDKDPSETQDETWSERVRFKSTLDFVSLMDQYIEQLPEFIFIPTDYVYGSFSAKREWIRDRFLVYGTYPVKKRLAMVADDIHDRLETDNIMEQEVPRPWTILRQPNSMLTMKDTLAVCKDFCKQMGIPEYFAIVARKTLEWVDVYLFLYSHSAFQGLKKNHITGHLVIDGMRDYTPVQCTASSRMFPCRRTILGDFGRSVNLNHLHGLEDLRIIYNRAQFAELNKSYRFTYETMRSTKRTHHVSTLEPVKHHGEPPALIPHLDAADEIRKIREAIRYFRAGKNVSLGIVLRTDAAAKDMCEVLVRYDGMEENQVEENQVKGNGEEARDISLLTRGSTSFQNGISITSVHVSKGLESNGVPIPQADCRTYTSDSDRDLLYIACTRAMHRLTLTYSEKGMELIFGQPPFL